MGFSKSLGGIFQNPGWAFPKSWVEFSTILGGVFLPPLRRVSLGYTSTFNFITLLTPVLFVKASKQCTDFFTLYAEDVIAAINEGKTDKEVYF